MLASLPGELLRLVIEAAVPLTSNVATHRGHQATLRSLSLVSHRTRQIAQPLLRQVVLAESDEALENAVAAAKNGVTAAFVLHAAMDITMSKKGNVNLARRAVRTFRNLRTLGLVRDRGAPFRLWYLKDLQHLVSLQLCGPQFAAFESFTLPSLQDLSLAGDAAELTDLLDPSILPSLKYLALQSSKLQYASPTLVAKFDSALSQLAPQLDALSAPWYFFAYVWKPRPDDYLSRILADYKLRPRSGGVLLSVYHHIRLRSMNHDITQCLAVLAVLAKLIAQAPSPVALRALYLNLFHRQSALGFSGLESALDELRRACQEKGIEMVERVEQPGRVLRDSLVSYEFWNRQKQIARAGRDEV